MTAKIIDGKALAAEIRSGLAKSIQADNGEDMPVLAVVVVGEDEASKIYVRNKQKAAAEIGMGCEIAAFAETIGENALMQSIEELNANPHIHGIIVQQPLPPHLNPLKVLSKISAEKDVDGFSPANVGRLSLNQKDAVAAATPKGIMKLLENIGISLAGKHAVVIGRSNIVGRPLGLMLLNADCTVTVCHSHTRNLSQITREADILVAACGCAKLVKKDWVKPGAAVIDVGINREDGKLCGDVDFEEVKETASYITPVPGGVGPMTVAMLLENTWEAYQKQKKNGVHHCHGSSCCCHHSS